MRQRSQGCILSIHNSIVLFSPCNFIWVDPFYGFKVGPRRLWQRQFTWYNPKNGPFITFPLYGAIFGVFRLSHEMTQFPCRQFKMGHLGAISNCPFQLHTVTYRDVYGCMKIESDLSPQGEIAMKSYSNRRINFEQLCDLKTYLKLFGHENYNITIAITDIISDNAFRVI